MATTYTLISSVTVGSGGAANIEFTSIPNTYTDLLLKVSGRSSRTGAVQEEFRLSFNNNTSGYSDRQLRGSGSTAISQSWTSQANIQSFGQPGAGATANTFSNWEIYIPNYASSNNKSVSLDGVTENNATEAYSYLAAALWANSSAITSIKIDGNGYNLVQYTTAYLYGISNA